MKSPILISMCLGLFILSAEINAQCLDDSLSNNVAGTDFGSWLVADGDMNNDGYNDIVVEANLSKKVYVYSGKTLEILYTFNITLNNYNSTPQITLGGDVNYDGYDDLIVGAPAASPPGVYVYSGRTGEVLYVFNDETDGTNLGNTIDYAGDVNNDGRDDVIALDDLSKAVVFSGRTGEVLYKYTNEAEHDLWGILVGGLGDVNNDGYDDIFISDAGSIPEDMYGWLYVMSGYDGDTLFAFTGKGADDVLGWIALGPGDINNDGYDDILTSSMDSTYLFSGATGEVLLATPVMARWFFKVGDTDIDGIPELGIIMRENSIYKTRIYSGATFSEIFEVPGVRAAAGDIYNDGYPEIIIAKDVVEEDSLAWLEIYKYGDSDCDGVIDELDVCPDIFNPDQEDHDGDGIGDSCDTCVEIEFNMSTAVCFIEGTAPAGEPETAQTPFQIKVTSWLEDCYPSDTISAFKVTARYDANLLIFDSAHINPGMWDGYLEYEEIQNGHYNDVSVTLLDGHARIQDDYMTFCFLDFRAKCQANLQATPIDITSPSQPGNCWIIIGEEYFPSKFNDGRVTAVMGEFPCYTCGDFDGSGSINILDITAFVKYLYKGAPAPTMPQSGDVDNSGELNIIDISVIVNYLYRNGPELNCP